MKDRRFTAILNPMARNGKARRGIGRVTGLLEALDSEMPVLLTEGPGHAIELARDAAATSDVVIAIGGDGTLHEVANGLIQSQAAVALGIVPFGTGNDYVKMTKTPRKLESAIKLLEKGKRKAVDYGILTYQFERGKESRFFINTAGVGLDAEVGFRVSSFKGLPGFTAYLAALFYTLRDLKSSDCKLFYESETTSVQQFHERLLLCSFGNGRHSGGLFPLTPAAAIDDGLIDICAIKDMPLPRILRYIPRVLRGAHLSLPECHSMKGTGFSISVDPGMFVHADGEILAHHASHMHVQLVKHGLTIISA